MIIAPPKLSDLTEQPLFFESMGALEHFEGPAMELFGRHKNQDGSFDPQKIDIEKHLKNLSAFSTGLAMKSLDNLSKALGDWQHQLSKQLNDSISKLYKANEAQIKLFNADLKRVNEQIKSFKKTTKEPGLSPELKQQADAQYQEALDRRDRLSENIRAAKQYIRMTPEMLGAINEATNLALASLKLLDELYGKYQKTLNARFKPEDLRYQIDRDHYIAELLSYRETLFSAGELGTKLTDLSQKSQNLCNARIYGHGVDPEDPQCTAQYDITTNGQITNRYNSYKKLVKNIRERILVIRNAIHSIEKDTPSNMDLGMVAHEIAFLTNFCMHYSDAMLLYLRPMVAMLEAVGTH
jgi:hypothetical protein